jgi:ABC-type multidrug transport system ATPase subunit
MRGCNRSILKATVILNFLFIVFITGGQKKRLSIALEIISLPKVILLDEPTSGLDSARALEVMNYAKILANPEFKVTTSSINRTTSSINVSRVVIATIHQPSNDIFNLFDKLLLINNGYVNYFGPIDQLKAHFTSPKLGYVLEKGFNYPEFIIDICMGDGA